MSNSSLFTQFTKNSDGDDLAVRCWGHNECWDCLRQKSCGWCPFTSACVPNPDRIPILAPIFNADVCPYWSERWELRTRPMGCNVSTLTFLTSLVTIFSTFFVIGLIVGSIVVLKLVRVRWRTTNDGWWKFWKHSDRYWKIRNRVESEEQDESRALLGD